MEIAPPAPKKKKKKKKNIRMVTTDCHILSCHAMQKKEAVWEEAEEEQLEEHKDMWRGLAAR
jgi:NRPS condensation-like uncharacterized protein